MTGKSDLATLLAKKYGDRALGEGEEGEEEGKEGSDIDEELLLEMCKFSNMSTANNLKKASGNGMVERKNGNLMQGGLIGGETKNVQEDFDIDFEGERGENGRPRYREEEKLPPQYENINLVDPEDEVLF